VKHFCKNKWVDGRVSECPLHLKKDKTRPVVPGADTKKRRK